MLAALTLLTRADLIVYHPTNPPCVGFRGGADMDYEVDSGKPDEFVPHGPFNAEEAMRESLQHHSTYASEATSFNTAPSDDLFGRPYSGEDETGVETAAKLGKHNLELDQATVQEDESRSKRMRRSQDSPALDDHEQLNEGRTEGGGTVKLENFNQTADLTGLSQKDIPIHHKSVRRIIADDSEDDEELVLPPQFNMIVPDDEPPDDFFDQELDNDDRENRPPGFASSLKPSLIFQDDEDDDDEVLTLPTQKPALTKTSLPAPPAPITNRLAQLVARSRSKVKEPAPRATTILKKGILVQRNYRIQPTDTNSFRTAKSSSDRKIYFSRKTASEVAAFSSKFNSNESNKRPGSLLVTSIYTLFDEIEAEAKIVEAQTRSGSTDATMNEVSIAFMTKNSRKKENSALLVDKYAPQKYVDLVGEEKANRNVLMWVREWDYCVFGKPVRIRDGVDVFAGSNNSKWYNKKQPSYVRRSESHEASDPLKRPRQKILLLSGPPGLGKTTLVHVIARHCGYRCVEINASDDRTSVVLQSKFLSAVESQSVMGDRRPNLVVIDEIDGASQTSSQDSTFMSFLTSLAATETLQEDGKKGGRKRRSRLASLQRPIICICNDLYAPVMRPLRMVAYLVRLPTPPPKPIARRIGDICRWELIKIDARALNLMIEIADGDIRSCLHTLQFLQRQKRVIEEETRFTKISVADVQGLDVGHKDVRKGLFRVWEEIFCRDVGKQKLGGGASKTASHILGIVMREDGICGSSEGLGVVSSSDLAEAQDTQRLLATIRSNGDYDKIMEGVFENYLRARILDTTAAATDHTGAPRSKIEEALEWMSFYDVMQSRVNKRQQWELSSYLPYPAVAFHRLFANALGMPVNFPRTEYDNYTMHKTCVDLIKSFEIAWPVGLRQTWPSMIEISLLLTPMLISILNIGDKTGIPRVADLCASFGLRLVSEKPGELDSLQVGRLEPPIDKLAPVFDKSKMGGLTNDYSKRLLTGPPGMRQIVNAEIEKALTKQRAVQSDLPSADSRKTELFAKRREDSGDSAAVTDFFGRAVATTANLFATGTESRVEIAKARFRYNEGVSNAVRKIVRVSDFY
ncbi:hypothetical protein SeLEV6574_g00509 [Synchytrium endobioticum]|uniref:AAA+ ATPase domain-containing protein n=1 Tax=Synchytrium endobioticum TaxID=286115 RepID=A0A507DIJ5_9FUNG|nr:hypothetical protein SeLEV6574_g00509 [Synchytrium endobioticum]